MVHPENDSFGNEDLSDLSGEMRERVRKSLEEYWPRMKAQAEGTFKLAQEMSGLWARTARVMVDAFVAEGFSVDEALKLTLEMMPKKWL